MANSAESFELPRLKILSTELVGSVVVWVGIVILVGWASTVKSHYDDLRALRHDIVCERGLTLLASTNAADVARGDTIVRETRCPVVLDAEGNVPSGTEKLDAFLVANPNGLEELMGLYGRSGFTGPWYADPIHWYMGWVCLFAAFVGNACIVASRTLERHVRELG